MLSGNRNFEGRISPDVQANYLASPPLVVAHALAGTVRMDLTSEPLGEDQDGNPVYLKDIWPTTQEIQEFILKFVTRDLFAEKYADVFKGDENWQEVQAPAGQTYAWDENSTYVQNPPYFTGMGKTPKPVEDIKGARILGLFGDKITTDHISPAGSIKAQSPAGAYLMDHGVDVVDFNQYGTRRGNHEVMMRGTFANIRIRNHMMGPNGREGGYTIHYPSREEMSIYDAAMKYKQEGVPLVIFAGAEYGNGSSRDWAAKGTNLLGVRAVIAQSYERIHRSNLVGMGVIPFVLADADASWESLGLKGDETVEIDGLADDQAAREDRRQSDICRRHGEGYPDPLPHRHAGRARLRQQWRHPADGAARPRRVACEDSEFRQAAGAFAPAACVLDVGLDAIRAAGPHARCRGRFPLAGTDHAAASPLRDFLLKWPGGRTGPEIGQIRPRDLGHVPHPAGTCCRCSLRAAGPGRRWRSGPPEGRRRTLYQPVLLVLPAGRCRARPAGAARAT